MIARTPKGLVKDIDSTIAYTRDKYNTFIRVTKRPNKRNSNYIEYDMDLSLLTQNQKDELLGELAFLGMEIPGIST